MSDIKIDLGGGQNPRQGYINIDQHAPTKDNVGDWSDTVDIQFDLTIGIPLEDNSVQEIYSGHFFEHLAKLQVPPMLSECYRVLEIGGKIEVDVPDLLNVMRNFINKPDYGWGLDSIFGGQAHEGEFHKTGYWPFLLRSLFSRAGFTDINVYETEGWGQPCLKTVAFKR